MRNKKSKNKWKNNSQGGWKRDKPSGKEETKKDTGDYDLEKF
jgi:hypothetical protein